MANLIYFFRYIFRHPELIDRFGEDVEELLGLKEESVGEVKFKALGLDSLINLILGIPLASGKGIDIYQYLNDPRFNFKRHLVPILQKTVYSRTTNIMIHRQEDIIFKIMVDNDFQRATTWTEYVDRKPKHAYKPIGRKILLSGN